MGDIMSFKDLLELLSYIATICIGIFSYSALNQWKNQLKLKEQFYATRELEITFESLVEQIDQTINNCSNKLHDLIEFKPSNINDDFNEYKKNETKKLEEIYKDYEKKHTSLRTLTNNIAMISTSKVNIDVWLDDHLRDMKSKICQLNANSKDFNKKHAELALTFTSKQLEYIDKLRQGIQTYKPF